MTTLPSTEQLAARAATLVDACGATTSDGDQPARTPITGGSLGTAGGAGDVDAAVERAAAAFRRWRDTPAPVRGNVIRRFGELLREHKAELGELVSIEAGKIRSEGLGEVQEMIDICDFAVGLSRQLHGLTIASERPGHRLMETWHPMGPVGVISAFNFPVAVWSWNTALAVVCGNPVIWKPSDKTPLTALACQALIARAAADAGAPADISQVCSAAARSARRWLRTRACRSSPPPVRRRWAARWRRWSPPASGGRSSSWAATTPRSSRPPPTSTSPCAASCSPPPAPPVSAAPACAA